MWKLDAVVECFIGGGKFSVLEERRVSLALVTFFLILCFALLRVE